MKLIKAIFFVSIIIPFQMSFAYNIGDKVNDFRLKNQEGKSVKLSSFKSQYIVLEWFNEGCPYVKKHYRSGHMQSLQKLYRDNEYVTWLTISSSAKGKQGYIKDHFEGAKTMERLDMASKHLLLDSTGIVGQDFQAKVTPHIFIIDHKGILRYQGAIDSIASADSKDIKRAKNYITDSISRIMLGKNPKPAKTKAYGCSVKY